MADLFGFRRSGRAVRARVGYWLGGGAKKSAHRARRLSPSGGHHRHGPAGPPGEFLAIIHHRRRPRAGVEPQPEMAHVAKNTTDMKAQTGSSWACRPRMARRLEPEQTSTSPARLRLKRLSPVRLGSGRRGRGTEQGRDRRRHRLGGRGPAPWRVGCGVSRGRLRYQDRTVPAFFVKRMSSSRRPRAVAAGQAGHEWVSRSSADRSNPGVSLHETGPELSEHASGHGEKSDKFR